MKHGAIQAQQKKQFFEVHLIHYMKRKSKQGRIRSFSIYTQSSSRK